MSKSYILAIVIIGVYLLIINPITSKEKEEKEDAKNSKEAKKESSNSNGSITAGGDHVAGFDYSLITDEVLDNLSTNKTTSNTPTYTL